jgi:hypothetical protein
LKYAGVKLSITICSIVGDIVSGSHDTLNELFITAGAPGDPPAASHGSKWKKWLKKASDDPECDSHLVLGRIITAVPLTFTTTKIGLGCNFGD